MSQLWTNVDAALGLGREAATLTFAQVSLRGVFERNGHITVVPKRT